MKVYLDTIGCRLNQSEIEKIARDFRANGHSITALAAEADLIVVNTCTVTNAAASDSRQKIRQVARVSPGAIAVTGCWATLEPEAARNLPQVGWVIENQHKDSLAAMVLDRPEASFDLEPLAREPLPGAHQRTRAFIKAQDGCDNFCTFCITRIARGPGRSETIEAVVKEVRSALDGGTREAVLSGVHLGSWGKDFQPAMKLGDLIQAILMDTDIERLRLSSLEPWDLDEAFFRLWENPRMCRHLHLPLQSGCKQTLKRMVRNTTPEAYFRLVEMARSQDGDMAVTTDLIAGFPGETNEEFEESLAFVERIGFASGHVFSYSLRPGTAAARMKGQVAGQFTRERAARMRAVIEESGRRFRERFLGQQALVLWESVRENDRGQWVMQGLTDTYQKVQAISPTPLWNQISRVQIDRSDERGLSGKIINPGSDFRTFK